MRRAPLSYPLAAVVAAAALLPVAVLLYLGVGAGPALSPRALGILGETALLTGLSVAGAVLIGVPLAVASACVELPLRRFWLVALTAPLAMPSYIGAFALFAAFGPGGEIEHLLGLTTPPVRGLWGAALVMALYTYPFVLLTTRASLRGLDAGLVDAARTLGLSLPMALLRVVLPRVRNGIAAGALLSALYTLSDFATPAIMQVDTFTRVIFIEYNAFGLSRAALLSLQLLTLVAVVLFLESRVGSERERPGRALSLRLRALPTTAVLVPAALVLAAAIGLPLAVFGAWLAREGTAGFDPAIALNSAYTAALAAAGTVIIALPVAYAASAGRVGRGLERVTYLGFGIPGIVMGTALVYVGLRVPFLYQTLALLILAYMLRFLPLAVGAVRSTNERLDRNLVGAARSLGATPAEAFRRVTLPLTLRGIIAGAALVFLEVMRELPATLLLRPTGFESLATELWRVYEAGYFGRAAVPGLLLVLVSGLALLVMTAGEQRIDNAPARDRQR
ncbi:hypothetical protein KBTX_04060 [wastewater metagenome]|uniref:ABC transmembrane type-1 domain-containing protein n=4 Tax=root TaxID=1 RepID=A0A5B8RF75_9ZZZZ|nr:hypothetical protein KBTEX_04060 [uncultured organism]